MRIGVPAESKPGETRVAATPKTVGQLIGLGYDVVVERGAGARVVLLRRGVCRGRRHRRRRPRGLGRATSCSRSTRPTDAEIALLRPGAVLASLVSPALNPDLVEQAHRRRRHRARDGRRAPHLARPVARRALVDGQHRRLPRRHRGGPRVRLVLHRPGHRGRQGAAGQGARRRRRRRRSRRDRHRQQPRRHRAGLRRARRGRRAGRVDGRRVPAHRRSSDEGPSATGYAKEMGEDFNRKAAELYAEQAKDVDIVITTALIPGRPAPAAASPRRWSPR